MNPILSARARLDIRIILSASEARFGLDARRRYRLLLERSIADLAADPGRAGVQEAAGLRLYHTRHARARTPPRRRVARPRHVIVFRIVGAEVEVLRVLHDAMDLPSYLADL